MKIIPKKQYCIPLRSLYSGNSDCLAILKDLKFYGKHAKTVESLDKKVAPTP